MLPIMPLSSTFVTSRGEPSTSSQRCASSRNPPRISFHSASLTWDVFRAVGNALMVILLGRPLLGALDRAARRMHISTDPLPVAQDGIEALAG